MCIYDKKNNMYVFGYVVVLYIKKILEVGFIYIFIVIR